jgi:hypothetical protein
MKEEIEQAHSIQGGGKQLQQKLIYLIFLKQEHSTVKRQ